MGNAKTIYEQVSKQLINYYHGMYNFKGSPIDIVGFMNRNINFKKIETKYSLKNIVYKIKKKYAKHEQPRVKQYFKQNYGIDIHDTVKNCVIFAKTSPSVDRANGETFYVYGTNFFADPENDKRYILKIFDSKYNTTGLYEKINIKNLEQLFKRTIVLSSIAIKFPRNFILILILNRRGHVLADLFKEKTLSESHLDLIFDKIIEILQKFCTVNITHGDLHFKNMEMSVLDDNNFIIYPFDMGTGSKYKCFPKLELLQILRSLHLIKFHNPANRDYLETKFFNYYKSLFPDSKLQKTYSGLYGYNNMYLANFEKYYNEIYLPLQKQYLQLG